MAKKPIQSATAQNQQAPAPTGPLKCGDVQVYSKMQKRATNRQQRDHVPATNSMLAAADAKPGYYDGLSAKTKTCIKNGIRSDALTIAIPKQVHRQRSRTCCNKGGQARVNEDIKDLKKAAEDDFKEVEPGLSDDCKKKYEEAKKKVLEQLPDKLFDEVKAKCLAK
jgi:hypothetical protein